MKVKNIVSEDFSNYKKISMFIGTSQCNWKCCKECGADETMCQNSPLAKEETKDVDNSQIITRYLNDPLTNALVIGGLEPFDQFSEIKEFISEFRNYSEDDIVIYTGYNEDEIKEKYLEQLSGFKNIIIKFGRYIPDDTPVYDEVLGITLASSNQYAKRLEDVITHVIGPVTVTKVIINSELTHEEIESIKLKLKENGGYCPCRIRKNEDTKCMCKEFREIESGICYCGLYEKIKEEI